MNKLIDIGKLAVLDIETVGVAGTFIDLQNKFPRLGQLWTDRSKWLKDRYNDTNGDMSIDELWQLKSGLHPEYGKVICVTFGVFQDNEEYKLMSFSDDNEYEVLRQTNDVLSKCDSQGRELAGHTIERFDIPFLWKRMLVNRIRPANIINNWNKKPWEIKNFDVAKFWSGGAWQEGFTSLDTMSALFDIKSPKAEMQASRVHDLYWHHGGLSKIKDYCEGDVTATMDVIKILSNI